MAALQKGGWPVTVCIGLATFVSPPGSTDEMMKKADELLYAAKHGGKNMVKRQTFEGTPGASSFAPPKRYGYNQ